MSDGGSSNINKDTAANPASIPLQWMMVTYC